MNKWILIMTMAFTVMACNRQTSMNTTDNNVRNSQKGDMTPKSGESNEETVAVIDAPSLETYDDLKQVEEGTLLSERELANKICFCSYELTRMNDDVKRYHRNNDKNSLLRVKSNVDRAFAKFDKCMAKIKADYPKAVAENDPQMVFGEVEKQCPGVVEIMEAGNQALKDKATGK